MAEDMIRVPDPDAGWYDIAVFALTFNGYERVGDLDRVASVADQVQQHWTTSTDFPNDVAALRTALFFEQRRFHHYGWDPSGPDLAYIKALVAAIRDQVGGELPGPEDP